MGVKKLGEFHHKFVVISFALTARKRKSVWLILSTLDGSMVRPNKISICFSFWFAVIHHVGTLVTFVFAVHRRTARTHTHSVQSAATFTGIFGVVFTTLVRTIYARGARTWFGFLRAMLAISRSRFVYLLFLDSLRLLIWIHFAPHFSLFL